MRTLPTKLYLHLSGSSEWADYTVFTRDMRNAQGVNTMHDYPFVLEFTATYAPGTTNASVEAVLAAVRLGSLYQQAGELQAKLDAKKEEISKLLCIGQEKPIKVEAELMPRHESETLRTDLDRFQGIDPFDDQPF